MTAERFWDDPEIQQKDLFLRTVPRKPMFIVPNLLTRQPDVLPAALRFDDDGMSVDSSKILTEEGQDRRQLCVWETHTTVEFPAFAARSTEEAGVVPNPVVGHPRGEAFGKAHSLVRTKLEKPTRDIRRNIQAAIAAHCRWIEEDPEKPKAEQE